ncbi:putative Craniofacial development protein 1 [Nannochloris sp. 'desiccata']|nr:putative Craniofacial development protein 1 [Chlorella desiccata (nom. nud.)]
MTSLAAANLPSSDEEDEDFVPDEVDSEDEAQKRKNAPPKKKRGRVRGAAAIGAAGEDSDGDGAAVDSDGDGDKKSEPVIPEHKRIEKKAKMDELWSKMNSSKGTKPKPAVNLAALCKPVTAKQSKDTADQSWMRQLGLAPSTQQGKPKNTASVAAAALAAAKTAASATAAQQYGMLTVTETRRFAGKNVTVQRDVDANSKEAATAGINGAGSSKQKAGLDAVLESLAQAKKVTVLDKSRIDWKDYKKTDDTVDEELEAHKRSGTTYLEKKEFLSKADLAEYERERDQRLASDVRNRGRL